MYVRNPELENSILLDYLVSNLGMMWDFPKRCKCGIY